MNALEDKATSRNLAKKAGVPTPPGSEGPVENEQDALAVAKRIGYPVMIKAIAGGGGRGMRVAHNDVSLVKGYHTARSEAEKAFGNSGVYIEKYIENPTTSNSRSWATPGNIIHLGERDCSIQRRNQKVVEETPRRSSRQIQGLRKKMGKAAVRIAEVAHYTNAGTVEFSWMTRATSTFSKSTSASRSSIPSPRKSPASTWSNCRS
jgi:acetyl-CoA carboxylase, biotin carboxylase subunit